MDDNISPRRQNPVKTLTPANKVPWSQQDREDANRTVHHGIGCDGQLCAARKEAIVGLRYRCSDCENFDLCTECFSSPDVPHDQTHLFYECLEQSLFIDVAKTSRDERERLMQMAGREPEADITDLRSAEQIEQRDRIDAEKEGRQMPYVRAYVLAEEDQFPGKKPLNIGPGHDMICHDDPKDIADMLYGRLTRFPYLDDGFYRIASEGIPCTRVIDLHPGEYDEKLRCTLRCIRFQDAADYEAVSYTWKETAFERSLLPSAGPEVKKAAAGFGSIRYTILCGNNTYLEIPAGLHDALVNLRDTDATRTLWVDQLCINQQDHFERNLQVQHMGHIYNAAKRVIVWVGIEDKYTWVAFELLHKLGHLGERLNGTAITKEELERAADVDFPPTDRGAWLSILHLLDRPVFQRAWVMQEIVLGQAITVACGRFETEWSNIVHAVNFYHSGAMSSVIHNHLSGTGQRRLMSEASHMIAAIRYEIRSGAVPTLSSMLYRSAYAQASDARDKIFALRAIHTAAFHGNPDPRIEVDYQRSVAALYRDVARAILTSEPNLAVLSMAGKSQQQLDGLPTWVPDWTFYPRRGILTEADAANPYHAAGTTKPGLASSIREKPNLLSVSTIRVASVATATHCGKLATLRLDRIVKECDQLIKEFGRTYITGEPAWEALLRTLSGNGGRSRFTTYPLPNAWLGRLVCQIIAADIEASMPNSRPPSEWKDDYPIFYTMWEDVSMDATSGEHKFVTSTECDCKDVLDPLRDRVFFTTARGHFAIGAEHVRPGDEIHIMAGCPAPMVLRAKSTLDNTVEYEVISDAYVHGIMDGQLTTQIEADWRDIQLR